MNILLRKDGSQYMLQKLKIWLTPKGFWGYFGVALFVLLAAATGYQLAFHPYMILDKMEAFEIQMFVAQLLQVAQQCSMN